MKALATAEVSKSEGVQAAALALARHHAQPRVVAARMVAAVAWPLRALRTLGAIETIAEADEVPWEDPAWWDEWSATASFRPAAQEKFLARGAQSARPALEVTTRRQPHLAHDLFSQEAFTPEPTVCACGAVYAFLTPRCPSCQGDDPLASVLPGGLDRLQQEFEAYFGAALTADSLTTPASELARLLRLHAEALIRDPGAQPEQSERQIARELQQDFERRISIAGISHDGLRALASATQQAPLDLLRVSMSVTLAVRQLWQPQAKTGWCPTAEAARTLQSQLASTWQPAFDALKALSEARLRASDALQPVQRSLRKIAHTSPLERMVRAPLGMLRPARARGAHFQLEAGRWMFRERRAALALERFTDALTRLQAATANAANALEQSVRGERNFGLRRARALAAFLCVVLANDYGRASPACQHAIATRVGKLHRKLPSARMRGKRAPIQAVRGLLPAMLAKGALSFAMLVLLLYWLNT